MSADQSPLLALSDGHTIPQLGLGVYKASLEETKAMVGHALDVGYRLIDTAAMYLNEEAVGEALQESSVPRSEVFVQTKFWLEDLGYQKTLDACRASLERLNLDYVDLYMIHWPAPQRDLYVESWQAMETLREEGLTRSIAVCNFHSEHLERIISLGGAIPVINQVEVHPWLTQEKLLAFHDAHSIVTQAWSPLARGQILDEPLLAHIAQKLGVSVAQVVIRWHLQRGYSVIPKSTHPERIDQNADVFNFSLSDEDMRAITGLNRDYRTGVDPNDRN
jgi:2,5-diketo-D-gluconate reductase A